MPLTSNGKVDRSRLFRVPRLLPTEIPEKGARKFLSQALEALQLPAERLAERTFLELGGDSGCAVALAAECARWLAVQKRFPELLDALLNKSLEEVATLLGSNDEPAKRKTVVAEAVPDARAKKRTRLNTASDYGMPLVWHSSKGGVAPLSSLPDVSDPPQQPQLPLSWRTRWSVNLHKCIDASPLVALYALPLAATPRTPLDGALYVGSHSSEFVCCRLDDGREVWRTQLGGRIEATATLTADRRGVLVGCYDGYLYTLCVSTGEVISHLETKGPIKSTPAVCQESGLGFVGSHDGFLYAFHPGSGNIAWQFASGPIGLTGTLPSWFSSPCLASSGSLVCAAALNGRVVALRNLRQSAPSTPDLVWSMTLPHPVFSSLAATESELIVGCVDSAVYGLALASGEVAWRVATGAPVFSSPCVCPLKDCGSDQTTIATVIGCHDAILRAIDGRGNTLWEFVADSELFASPFAAPWTDSRNAIVVASKLGTLYLLSADSGDLLSKHSLPSQVFSSPVMVGSTCFVGCRDDLVYALDLTVDSSSSAAAAATAAEHPSSGVK